MTIDAMTEMSTDSATAHTKTTPQSNPQANKETALALSYAIMRGQWDAVEQLLADDFVYIGDGKPAMNKAQYIGFMQNVLCSAMTQMDMQFPRVLAQDDLVAADYTNDMTHSGVFMGLAGTGKRVRASGQFIRQVRAGKVTAEWQTTNALGLSMALGAIPARS